MSTLADYNQLLRLLLPLGSYEQASGTTIEQDIRPHARVFAELDASGEQLLLTIATIPDGLLSDYELDYGLPGACVVPVSAPPEVRRAALLAHQRETGGITRADLRALLARFDVELVGLQTYKPMQCIAPCTNALDSERSRFKVRLDLQRPINADMSCIIDNYLPAALRVDIREI